MLVQQVFAISGNTPWYWSFLLVISLTSPILMLLHRDHTTELYSIIPYFGNELLLVNSIKASAFACCGTYKKAKGCKFALYHCNLFKKILSIYSWHLCQTRGANNSSCRSVETNHMCPHTYRSIPVVIHWLFHPSNCWIMASGQPITKFDYWSISVERDYV